MPLSGMRDYTRCVGPWDLYSAWLGNVAPSISLRVITKLRLGKSKDTDRVEGRSRDKE